MLLKRWNDELTSGETDVIAKQLASILLSRIRESETRRELRDSIDRNDFLAVSDLRIDYSCTDAATAYLIRQIQALFQKRSDHGDDVAREINAFRSFTEAERQCKLSNERFRSWSRGAFQFPPDVEAAFFKAQRKISMVLGDVPELCDLQIRFGPGSTTSVPKRSASFRKKLSAPFACSGDLSSSVGCCLEEMPLWAGLTTDTEALSVPVEIHTGKLIFVPKDRKTFRAIGPEPMLNGMFQLGIGTYLSRRLKRFGVDITDQTRNKNLARIGSIDGRLATVDLSSASDTVSIGLVEHLFPLDWYLFLSRFRTGIVEYGDRYFKLEKFSTMGNGYTFPLETLIFWALAQGICETSVDSKSISVYGDDIIVPTHLYDQLVRVLEAAGFSVNLKKSFAMGPFRESCGGDYLSGIDIRPYYLRGKLTTETAFSMYNYFAERLDSEVCSFILSLLDPKVILWGPAGFGDGHLHCDCFELQQRPGDLERGYRGGTFETYVWKSPRSSESGPKDYVLPSYTIYSSKKGSKSARQFRGFLARKIRGCVEDGEVANFLPEDVPSALSYKKGLLTVSLPGKAKYKRIKIYTFT